MPATYVTDLIARVRIHLMEGTADKWTDAQITEYINQAVGDLSHHLPYVTYSNTYFLGGTRLIDVSSLSYYKIVRIEYELGDTGERKVPKQFKSYSILGNYIEINDDSTPVGALSVSGTADGDVATHLQDDTLAQFTAAMAYSKVVNTTDNLVTYATVYNDTGDLTLNEDIFPDGDEDYEVYERVPVRVWYSTKHTYSETVMTFSSVYEDLVAEGTLCYAMMAYALYVGNIANIGGNVSDDFMAMAKTRLALYRKELNRIRPLTHTEKYG